MAPELRPDLPVLHAGERLRLRSFAKADLERLRRLAGDREVAERTQEIPHPYTAAMAEEWIAGEPARLEAGRLVWAVELEGEGLIGAIELRVGLHGRAELGYWIGRPYWGKGYATEAVRAVIHHGFGVLDLRRIHAHHRPENPASGRVLEKAGMLREGLLRKHALHRGEHPADMVVYGILAEDPRPAPGEAAAEPMRGEGTESVAIFPLEPHHWPEVRAVYLEGLATGEATFETEAPEWEEWDGAHLPFARLVAVRGGRVEGWAALAPVSQRPAYAGVAEVSVYVAGDARGQRIGAALLDRLVQESEGAGVWTLQAGIFPENPASIRLHRRAGFREVGRRERIGRLRGRWRDVVLLERRSGRVGVDHERTHDVGSGRWSRTQEAEDGA